MKAAQSRSPVAASSSYRVVAQHVADVDQVHQGRCESVLVDGRPVAIDVHPSQLPAVQQGDAVLVIELADQRHILNQVLTETPGVFSAQIVIENGTARVHLPEGIEQYEMVVGDSRVQLSEGRVRLNGRELLSEAEGRHRLLGHPIELN
ncbi:hypothetical protein [Saccharospirillum impatiens]|uniref:hypothetical protein n=1 Tax=Saccharospirillum impatiens TaxID=169438 RepID=UPI00048C97E2|nr:hypothetical protein [Saccharospirillum impatiens]